MSQVAMTTHVAHHFDDAEQQFEAANLGMWTFLATEVLFFGGMFAGYAQYRYYYPDAFSTGSEHLDLVLGTVNTGVLLTSSLTMALAVHAAQTDKKKSLVRMLLLTIILGLVFLGIKTYEYHHKYTENLVPGTWFEPEQVGAAEVATGHLEIFYSFYFAMTGMHAVHMIIGVVILGILALRAWQGTYSAEYFTPVELSGLYWHFVDIVWVFLFPFLYLVG